MSSFSKLTSAGRIFRAGGSWLNRVTLALSLLLLLSPLQAAILPTVKGTVTDSKGDPLPGVGVMVTGTNNGAVTDENGFYQIENVDDKAELEFTCIGMLSIKMNVASRTVINVSMKEDMIGLESVVVTGYTSMKRKELTGAIASISENEISRIPAYDISTSLVGVAGIRLDGSSIRIRGTRSTNAGNDPLIVLDGIPYDETLNSINPNDVASIDVLKDAASTAIYGAKGANGVILITTKQAKKGQTNVTYDGFVGAGINNWGTLDVMNADEYIAFQREASLAAGNWSSEADDSKAFFGSEVENIGKMDTNWMKGYFKKARIWHSHALSVSSGGDKTQYKISLNYRNNDERYKGDHRDYFYLNADITQQVFDFLKVGLSNRAYYSINNSMPGMFDSFLHMSPLTSIRDENGKYNEYPFGDPFVKNPYMNEVDGAYKNKTEEWKMYLRMFADITFCKYLKFTTNFAYTPAFSSRGYYYDNRSVGYTDNRNVAGMHNNRKADWVWNNILDYHQDFGKHTLGVTAVYEIQNRQTVNSSMSGKDQESPAYLWYNMGRLTDSKNISSGFIRSQMLSFIGKVQYDYDDRYIISASVREDGASQLSPDNRWAFFPSAAAAWRISGENFIQDNAEWITDLKLRASYGMTGNYSIAPYATLGSLYGVYTNFGFGGNTHLPGLEPSSRPTPNLGWERNKMLDIGLDFGFFDGRLYGTVEWYNSYSYDLLYLKVLPYTTGFNQAWTNIGDTRNRGWEISLSGVAVQKPDFNLNINVSWYRNKEELVRLQDPNMKQDLNNNLFVGYPVTGVHYNYKYAGIWKKDEADLAAIYGQKPGEVKVADLDGNGIINGDDRMILGTTRPDWVGSLSITGNWKNIDFAIDTYGEFGAMAYDGRSTGGWANELGRWNTYKIDYYTPDHENARYPRPVEGQNIKYLGAAGYYGSSYFNIRNITVGYTLPQKWMGRIVKKTRFYATINNPGGYDQFRRQGGISWWETYYMFGAHVKF